MKKIATSLFLCLFVLLPGFISAKAQTTAVNNGDNNSIIIADQTSAKKNSCLQANNCQNAFSGGGCVYAPNVFTVLSPEDTAAMNALLKPRGLYIDAHRLILSQESGTKLGFLLFTCAMIFFVSGIFFRDLTYRRKIKQG